MRGQFYPEEDIDKAFGNPPANFRGAPFWAWNGHLDAKTLASQLDVFKEMGFGGFHIHARIGLDTPYLGPDFMRLVKESNRRGKELGLQTWLYDEDKWPSGYGAGRVTKDSAFRTRYLLLSPHTYPDGPFDRHAVSSSRISRNGEITYLCSYQVALNGRKLQEYRTIERSQGNWHAYLIVTGDTPWFNNESYVDTLNPQATKRFIQVTYEAYASELGSEFGNSVRTIFTDEPQFFRYENFHTATGNEDAGIPFSEVLDTRYKALYGQSLLDVLPEIFWMPKKGLSVAKLRYHDLLSEQFSSSYAKILGQWCEKHNLLLTGHMMGESTLDLQSRMVGEAMRSYPYFGLPGIDMLAKRREYMTAKQLESAVHQEGKCGAMCEIYGVTNWDFDFRGHLAEGDWLAALGITARVPHLSWVTMAGEAKRDYPAPIDQHSPWYKEYPLIENHFARINLALTRGRNITHIGVIHPIESYWAVFGPDDDTGRERRLLEQQFASLAETLLFGQQDFEYLSECSIPRLYNHKLDFGQSTYQVLLVPGLITIRSTTLTMLKEFKEHGGKVIFVGQIPGYVDGKPSDEAKELAKIHCDFDSSRILSLLEPYREIDVSDMDFQRRDDLIYQLREDGQSRWLFVAHGRKRDRNQISNFRSAAVERVRLAIHGLWSVTLYDTFKGTKAKLPAIRDASTTTCEVPFFEQDSLLLRLEGAEACTADFDVQAKILHALETQELRKVDGYQLSEPNVALLDQASYALDDGPWQPKEEMLRLDDKVREHLGFSIRSEAHPQPWLYPPDRHYDHTVRLRFTFQSEVKVPALLALEMSNAAVKFNGSWIVADKKGFYVDRCLETIELGNLKTGRNVLELSVPYGWKTNLEWCYLLGPFHVRVEGESVTIAEASHTLGVGDLTQQGFPFYGGNFSYLFNVNALPGRWVLRVPEYKGSLIKVLLDGKEMGRIIGEPCQVDLGMQGGNHQLVLEIFGNRYNTFGQLHNTNPFEAYWGPKTWRTKDGLWTYSYRLKAMGILVEPLLTVFQ